MGSGLRRRPGSGGTDGRKMEMSASRRRHAVALAPGTGAKCRAKIRNSLMIGGMILLVVATGIVASAIAGMLNDRRPYPSRAGISPPTSA